jgi:hypothetical protein|tara:strand:+ start:19970 stop:20122 length:153 start_codon:yes stop_codon:yes gene_type:complete
LCKLGAIASIDGNVAERSRAVVLDVDVWGGEKLNEDGDSTGVNKLLAIVI